MLTISLTGAEALLDLLRRMGTGHVPDDAELNAVMDANAFFFGFYAGWPDTGREALKEALRHFREPERVPPGPVAPALAEGFREAIGAADRIAVSLAWVRAVDPAAIAARVRAYVPAGTPVDATIHVTVDAFNNAFAHRDGVGVSVLGGMEDRRTFEDTVAHELHHLGVAYWASRDATRQALLREASGRGVAVQHVGNLLSEGLANYYLTPQYVFLAARTPSAARAPSPAGPYEARLARLAREEPALMAHAESVLARCLAPGADHAACLAAYHAIAWDMEERMLPACHYLGARLIATLARVVPRDRILACVERLPEFLPRYNAAAREVGAYAFDSDLVARFARLWEGGSD